MFAPDILCSRCRAALSADQPACPQCGTSRAVCLEESLWYYVRERKKCGPLPWAQLQRLIDAGELAPHDMVLSEGTKKWLPVSALAGLLARWFYARDRKKLGPVSLAELQRLARSGELAPTDMVLEAGSRQWRPASSVPELFLTPAEPGPKATASPSRAGTTARLAPAVAVKDILKSDLEDLLDRFKAAWGTGQRPLIEDYLPTDLAHRKRALIELIHADLERRLKAGAPARVEEYLERYPELGHDEHVLIDLLRAEFKARRRREPALKWDEYVHRFPQACQATVAADQTRPPVESPGLGTPTTPEVRSPATSDFPSLPRYEILCELGRGGMGVVYQARQRDLKRMVAIKMILSGSHADAAELARFRTEAEALARLQHPNIVQIHDIGEHRGLPYFSLEFVDGGTLARKLARTPQAHGDCAALVETLARAVHAAHQRGVVHRDLKPGNVLLTADGTPKITDFGLAKQLDHDDGQTQTGAVMGTPAYMAPEQAFGKVKEIGPRSDVYALGAILYEALTGRPPFVGSTKLEVLDMVRTADPTPPRQMRPDIPRDLETICLKCLAKEPSRRYESALQLAQDLERFREGEPILARREGLASRAWRKVRRRPLAAALVAAVVLVASLGAWGISYYSSRANQAAAEKENESQLKTRALAEAAEKEAAEKEAQERAKEARKKADDEEARKRQAAYRRDIGTARTEITASNVGRADQVLDACPPDLRQWEWHQLKRLCRLELLNIRSADQPARAALSPDGTRLATITNDRWSELRKFHIRSVETGRAERTVFAHTAPITDLAFSPDGKRIASAGEDKEVKVWDLSTGKELHALKGHTDKVRCVAWSPDGKLIASAAEDQTVRVWDAAAGKELHTLKGHAFRVYAVAFSPDGKRLASGSGDMTIRIWDPVAGKQEAVCTGHKHAVWGVAFSRDGRQVASACHDMTIKLWDAATGKEERSLAGHEGPVKAVAFSPDGRFLASASDDRSIRLWDLADGKETSIIRGHIGAVEWLAFSPGGDQLVSAGDGNEIKVWDLTVDQEAHVLQHSVVGVTHVAVSADGRLLASGSGNGLVRICEAASGRTLQLIPAHATQVRGVAFSPDGKRLASCSLKWNDQKKEWEGNTDVKIWDVETGKLLGALPALAHPVHGLAFSPDGKRLATAGGDRTVRLWDATTRQEQAVLSGHENEIDSVAFSPDGRLLASASRDFSVKLWDVVARKEVRTLRGHTNTVLRVAFSPDGRLLASAGDRTARVWSVEGGKELAVLSHADFVRSVAFSRSAPRLATGADDKTIRLWDLSTGQEVHALHGHTALITSVGFSADGDRLISGSSDGTVRIWDPAPAPGLFVIRADSDLRAIAYSHDGRRVAACQGQIVNVWEVDTGRVVLTLRGHEKDVSDVTFSRDGRFLVTGSHDETVRIWDAATGKELRALRGHCGVVNAIAASLDSRLVVAAIGKDNHNVDDHEIVVWEIETGKEIRTLKGYHRRVNCVAFAPDGKRIVSGSWVAEIRVWDIETGQVLHTMQQNDAGTVVYGVAWSPDGKWIATADGGGGPGSNLVKVWDAATGKEQFTHRGHTHYCMPLAFSPDSRLVASGSDDGTVQVWDAATGKEVQTFSGLGAVVGVAFSPDGKHVAASGAGTLQLWELTAPRRPASARRGAVVEWHRRHAESAAKAGQWSAALLHLGPAVEALPDDADLHFLRGRGHANLARWEPAREALARALALRPNDPAVGCGLVLALNHLDQGKAADEAFAWMAAAAVADNKVGQNERWAPLLDDYTRAIERDPTNWRNLRARALVQAATGKNDGGVADCARTIELNRGDWGAWFLRAVVSFSKKEYDKAIEDLNEAIRLDANQAVAFSYRGVGYHEKKESDKALADLNEAVRLDPNSGKDYVNRATVHVVRKEFDRAIADYSEAIRLGSADSTVFHRRAAAHQAKKEYDRAIADYSEAIKLGTDDATTYNNRGFCFASKEEYDRAIADYTEAIRRDPGNPVLFNNRAIAYSDKEDYARALADHNEAIRLDPKPNYYEQRGLTLVAMHAFEKGLADLVEAVRLRNEDLAALKQRAKTLQGKELYALAAGLEVIRRDPSDGEIHYLCGNLRALFGDPDLAIPHFDRAIALGAQKQGDWLADAIEGRAIAFSFLGEFDKSIADYQELLKLKGDGSSAAKVREQIKKREGEKALDERHSIAAQILRVVRVGDREALRKACGDLLERYAQTEDAGTAAELAWACSIVPGTVADAARVVAVAQRAVDKAPKEYLSHRALSVALLRAGKYKEAIEQAEKTNELRKDSPFIALVLTIAHQRLGQSDEAKARLKQAVEWIEPKKRNRSVVGVVVWVQLAWYERLALETLRREAEALIEGKKP